MVKIRRRRRVKGFIRKWGGEGGARPPVVRIAHRGASGEGLAPENTIAAIELALQIGVDLVEIDVQVTADGHPVVMHDRTVDRTTNKRGPVDTLTLAEIRKLNAGGSGPYKSEGVPTLQDALDVVKKQALLLIEAKTEESAERSVSVIRSMRAQSRVVIQSFHAPSLRAVNALDRRIPTSFLMTGSEAVMRRPNGVTRRVLKLGANSISLQYRAARPGLIETFLTRALGFWVWTVDEEEDMREMIRMGVGGIITNYPDRLNKVLEEG